MRQGNLKACSVAMRNYTAKEGVIADVRVVNAPLRKLWQAFVNHGGAVANGRGQSRQ